MRPAELNGEQMSPEEMLEKIHQQQSEIEYLKRQRRVARLMRENGLVARAKKAFRPRTTTPGQEAAPNLIKQIKASGPDQVWSVISPMSPPWRDGFTWR